MTDGVDYGLLGPATSDEMPPRFLPNGACPECGTALVNHKVQCPKGEDCQAERLMWCPVCEDFEL